MKSKNKSVASKNKRPKYDIGLPGVSTALGVGGYLINSFASKDNQIDELDYAGNMLSNAGSLAGIGTAIAPGIGTAIGAVAGLGVGLLQTNAKKREMQVEAAENRRNESMYRLGNMSNIVASDAAINSNRNYSVAGYNKGTAAVGKPNAMVASEEGIKNPITGKIDVVPGKYNKNNPDVVPAFLQTGTSVYSKAPSSKLPFGKSTPADIAKKMKSVQDSGEAILKSKSSSRIDKKTAMLNSANIEKQSELLNMNTILENSQIVAQPKEYLPKFDKGYAWLSGTVNNGYGENYNFRMSAKNEKDKLYTEGVSDAYNDYKARGGDLEYKDFLSGISVKGDGQYTFTRPQWAINKQQSESKPQAQPQVDVLQIEDERDSVQDVIGFKAPVTMSDTAADPADKKDNGPKLNQDLFGGSEFGITDLLSLAPAIDNLTAGAPEVAKPRFAYAKNPVIRTNISKNLEDARMQRQIARYNQRVVGGGAYMPFALSSYGTGMDAITGIYSAAKNADNQYRMNSANIANQIAAENTNEMKRIDDLNARNRAAARTARSTGLSQIAQYAQNKQLMANQRRSDVLNSKIWEIYSGGSISPEILSKINKILIGG